MRIIVTGLFVFFLATGYSQQYDSLFIEEEGTDENNVIYIPGNVFVYDYEINHNGKTYKLGKNKGMFGQREFEFVTLDAGTIDVDLIHLIIRKEPENKRTNAGQTEVTYLQGPSFDTFSSTGAVENDRNIWIHPIRIGFFNSLETAPFPYVRYPLEAGVTWSDKMAIGQGWGDEMWGEWEGSLLLTYLYANTESQLITVLEKEVECLVTRSFARSKLGETMLTSYFSPVYGFVRLEYVLSNGMEVNFWLVDFKTGKEFNDPGTIFSTREYIKN